MKKNLVISFFLSISLITCNDTEREPDIDKKKILNNDYSTYPLVSTIHYRDGNNRVGDIIPFYYEGEYHVFYLQGDEWAHIVSTDLVNWRVLPFALRKGSLANAPDAQGIWTGSVIQHNSKFYLFYTGKNSNDLKGEQKVMFAESNDLINWKKNGENIIYADGEIYWNKNVNGSIDRKQLYHHQAFRDPHVFYNAKENKWWMVLHAVLADGSRPVMGIYTSPDLENWIPREPWIIYPNSLSGDCPDIFFENNQWYILSANYIYMRIDNFDKHRDPMVLPYDCGDLCVPKTMFDGKRRIAIGWITDYDGNTDYGAGGWGGIMSMPREIYADNEGKLMQRPLNEVVDLFSKQITPFQATMTSGKYERGLPENFMLTATIKPEGNPDFAELRVCSEGKGDVENYYLRIDFKNRRIYYGSKYRSYDRAFPYNNRDTIHIRWFIDGNVSECFVNDAYCFTMRTYNKVGNGIEFKSNGTTHLTDIILFTK